MNEKKIRKFFNAVNERDLECMGDQLNSDAEFLFPKTQPLAGKDRIVRFFKILFRQFPELAFDVKRVILQGQHAAVHWTNRGVGRDKVPYENEGVTLLEWEGEKIRFMSDFFKDTEKF
jgi:ketosteroid isomerase-like protein